MAARPNKAIAGCDPFADLVFSPRAAFIWDHTARAISWMNAAARSKFGKAVEDLQARLAPRLAQCFDTANGTGKTSGTVKFKAGRQPAISCSFDVLELAGGHKGLIVSEAAAPQQPGNVVRLPTPPKKKTIAKPSDKQPVALKPRQVPGNPAAPACQLTPEELRAFKAIGRTVRRLAKEKRRCANAAPEAASSLPPRQNGARADVRATPAPLFPAFDLVLFLGEDFIISRTEGRPQHIGWRKAGLLREPGHEGLAARRADRISPHDQKAGRRHQNLPRHACTLQRGWRQHTLPRNPWPLPRWQCSLFPGLDFA